MDADLTPTQREILRQASLHAVAGGVLVDVWTRGHEAVVEAGLAYRTGDRLAITKAGERALEEAGEVTDAP